MYCKNFIKPLYLKKIDLASWPLMMRLFLGKINIPLFARIRPAFEPPMHHRVQHVR